MKLPVLSVVKFWNSCIFPQKKWTGCKQSKAMTSFLSKYRKKNSGLPVDDGMPKCECNHITWGKNEFIELLSEEVRKLELLSKSGTEKKLKRDFMQLSSAMERLVFLQSWDSIEAVSNKFRLIDPDSIKTVSISDDPSSGLDKQADFLSSLSPHLKQAGFTEIPTEDMKKLFASHKKYIGDIELQVRFQDFDFLRIWVFGQTGSSEKKGQSLKLFTEKHLLTAFTSDEYKPTSGLCHHRVVVAAKNINKTNMIFKCFKDIPAGCFELLLPEAKIIIPRSLKWGLNIFLLCSGMTCFVNFGLWLQSEYKLGCIIVMLAVGAVIFYRTNIMYRNRRNRYMINWKTLIYYKSTSNNSALVGELLNRARGQSFKKTIFTYVAALQVARRNKGEGITGKEIEDQCTAWVGKMGRNYPDREVGKIDYGIGISNLLHMGILSYTKNKKYDVMDVTRSLKKVESELMALCKELCDSS